MQDWEMDQAFAEVVRVTEDGQLLMLSGIDDDIIDEVYGPTETLADVELWLNTVPSTGHTFWDPKGRYYLTAWSVVDKIKWAKSRMKWPPHRFDYARAERRRW